MQLSGRQTKQHHSPTDGLKGQNKGFLWSLIPRWFPSVNLSNSATASGVLKSEFWTNLIRTSGIRPHLKSLERYDWSQNSLRCRCWCPLSVGRTNTITCLTWFHLNTSALPKSCTETILIWSDFWKIWGFYIRIYPQTATRDLRLIGCFWRRVVLHRRRVIVHVGGATVAISGWKQRLSKPRLTPTNGAFCRQTTARKCLVWFQRDTRGITCRVGEGKDFFPFAKEFFRDRRIIS